MTTLSIFSARSSSAQISGLPPFTLLPFPVLLLKCCFVCRIKYLNVPWHVFHLFFSSTNQKPLFTSERLVDSYSLNIFFVSTRIRLRLNIAITTQPILLQITSLFYKITFSRLTINLQQLSWEKLPPQQSHIHFLRKHTKSPVLFSLTFAFCTEAI